MRILILISFFLLLTGSDTVDNYNNVYNYNSIGLSYLDRFYFNRIEESGTLHNYYGFIEINLDNFIRIKYNEIDEFYLIDSCNLDDDNVYHINGDDIILDIHNKTLSTNNKVFFINSNFNSRY